MKMLKIFKKKKEKAQRIALFYFLFKVFYGATVTKRSQGKDSLGALILFIAVVDQTRHKKGRRAKPRNWFYILICGGFESKLL